MSWQRNYQINLQRHKVIRQRKKKEISLVHQNTKFLPTKDTTEEVSMPMAKREDIFAISKVDKAISV